MSEFERVTEFIPAYDRRDEGYGIHGVDLLMLLRGPLGAVQFKLSTGWVLPESLGLPADYQWQQSHAYNRALGLSIAHDCYPSPSDLGYHSPRPMYEDQSPLTEDCPYIGGRCYYDGSGLNAGGPFYALLRGGSEGVWAYLENYYREVFVSPDAEPDYGYDEPDTRTEHDWTL